jgi:hypothetical protein
LPEPVTTQTQKQIFIGRKSGFNPANIPIPGQIERVATYANNKYNQRPPFGGGKYHEPHHPGPKSVKVKIKEQPEKKPT